MITETVLSRSIRLMFASGLVLGSMQVASAQEAAEPAMQRVEVTGSRIPTLNTEGASPVTTLSAKDIKIDGVRNVEDMLNNLPQVFAAQGSSISNGATGTATVSLRGLGSDRTLVLVNGKRLPAGSVSSTAADVNQVPAALIKRVEVLTGGAGAVYGAGAVAGVVNFILRDNFEGVEVQLNGSGYNHSQGNAVGPIVSRAGYPVPDDKNFDGKSKDVSVLMGGNFADNKGNATVFFSYKETDALLQSERDFSACALGSSTTTGFGCVGSGTNPTGRVAVNGRAGSFTNGANGTVRPYTAADSYNYGPVNFLQRPSQVIGFNARAHYDINDKARVYQEFNFHNYSTDAQVAPGGVFFGAQATLRNDNPLLSPAWKSALGITAPGSSVAVTLGKRNVEGGPRVADIQDTSYRQLVGLKGEVNNWTYDIFGQYSRVNHAETNSGYFSSKRIALATDVVPDPVTGQAACRSAVDGSDPNCVPYNMFTLGGITQAQLDYLNASGHSTGYTQQIVVGANVGSDLGTYGIKSPWATSGVGVSFGVERRAEKLAFEPDEASLSGDLAGSGGASPALVDGFSVKEVFGEFRLPLLEDKAFAKNLDLSGSFRRSDYSAGYKADTWGVGIDWAPVDSVRFRGSYQKAVRAPTIRDLFNPQSIGNNGPTNDPCEGAIGSETLTATAAECARTGLPANLYGNVPYNSANQHSDLNGGNPNVLPEEGTTKTFGLVFTPTKSLTLTLDYFDIQIADTISSVDPSVALDQCLTTGAPVFCNLIKRDTLGSLWLSPNGPAGFVVNTTANIGSIGTSGLDLGANYRQRLGAMGSLDLTMNGTWVDKYTVENVPGLGEYDCKGLFGQTCGTSTPEWRHKLRGTWITPWDLSVSATWRHFDSVAQERLSGQELLGTGAVAAVEKQLGARDYLDLNAAYNLTKKMTLSFGVNNVLDRDPPLASGNAIPAAGSANANTFPQVYDSMGRFVYMNLTARF
ncbi:TonB-dependent receptor domain-containing protein [Massilia soli]|nr:TonB-dependent receptor [Massilia soli]